MTRKVVIGNLNSLDGEDMLVDYVEFRGTQIRQRLAGTEMIEIEGFGNISSTDILVTFVDDGTPSAYSGSEAPVGYIDLD